MLQYILSIKYGNQSANSIYCQFIYILDVLHLSVWQNTDDMFSVFWATYRLSHEMSAKFQVVIDWLILSEKWYVNMGFNCYIIMTDEKEETQKNECQLISVYKSHSTWISAIETVGLVMEVHMHGQPICQTWQHLLATCGDTWRAWCTWKKSQTQDELWQCFTDSTALIQNNHENIQKATHPLWNRLHLCVANAGNNYLCTWFICSI